MSVAMSNIDALHAQALAEGFKDETCPKCGTLFMAHIHFVRCEAKPCPMVSTKDSRTILEQWAARTALDASREK